MAMPRMSAGCRSRMSNKVLLAIASMKPAPSVFVEIRKVRHFVLDRHHFDHVRVSGAGVHERAAEGLEELTIEHMADVLGHLACAAGDDVLMALPAGLGVICGPKTIANGLHLFEDEPVVVEGPQRYDCVLVQRLEIGTCGSIPFV